MIKFERPKFVLSAIAVLTLIAVVSAGAVCGVFAVSPWLTFLIGCSIGVIGLYAYHKVSVMLEAMRIINDYIKSLKYNL